MRFEPRAVWRRSSETSSQISLSRDAPLSLPGSSFVGLAEHGLSNTLQLTLPVGPNQDFYGIVRLASTHELEQDVHGSSARPLSQANCGRYQLLNNTNALSSCIRRFVAPWVTRFLPCDCNGVKNSSTTFDQCGVCGGNNSACVGCDGVPQSGHVEDDCGVCGGLNITCTDEYCDTYVDECGVCRGNSSSCAGCDGVPNSGVHFDACGVCNGTNISCTGCDGVLFSKMAIDQCGVCGGDGSMCTTPVLTAATLELNNQTDSHLQLQFSEACDFTDMHSQLSLEFGGRTYYATVTELDAVDSQTLRIQFNSSTRLNLIESYFYSSAAHVLLDPVVPGLRGNSPATQSCKVSVMQDVIAPCLLGISVNAQSSYLILNMSEQIISTSRSSITLGRDIIVSISGGLPHGDMVLEELSSPNAVSPQYRVHLNLFARPTGQESVLFAFGSATDIAGNSPCKLSPSQASAPLPVLPGISASTSSTVIAEQSFNSTIAMKLTTLNSQDVLITPSASAVNQIRFSPSTMVFRADTDDWSRGIELEISAVDDGVAEDQSIEYDVNFVMTSDDDNYGNMFPLYQQISMGTICDNIPTFWSETSGAGAGLADWFQTTGVGWQACAVQRTTCEQACQLLPKCSHFTHFPSSSCCAFYGDCASVRVATAYNAATFELMFPRVRVSVIDLQPGTVPPPLMISSRFSKSLTTISIQFDSNTNRAPTPSTTFSCSDIMVETALFGSSSTCSWSSASVLEITLGYAPTVRIGDTLNLRDDTLLGECQTRGYTEESCPDTRVAATGSIVVAGPDCLACLPVPLSVVSFASVIGQCDDLIFTYDQSSGGGGREFSSVSILAADSSIFVNATIDATRRRITVPRAALSGGEKYTFFVQLTNFMNNVGTSPPLKVSVSNDALPTFSLSGSLARIMSRTKTLRLVVAQASLPCPSDTSKIAITWSSMVGVGEDSNSHTVQLVIRDPYAVSVQGSQLRAGYTYNLTASAYPSNSPTLRVDLPLLIYVQRSPLVAAISGGTSRDVGVEAETLIDASTSLDPDNEATLQYAWTCLTSLQGVCTTAAGNAFSSSETGPLLRLSPGSLAAGHTYEIQVLVTDGGARNATAMTSVRVVAGDPPKVLITTSNFQPNQGEKISITAVVTATCSLGFSVEWTSNCTSRPDDSIRAAYVASLFNGRSSTFLADPHSIVTHDKISGQTTYKLLLSPSFPTVAGSLYFFRLQAIDLCGGSAMSTAPLVRMNRAPTGGSIIITPSTGTALNTTFLLVAPGWIDPESAEQGIGDSVLTYTFLYRVGTAAPQTLQTQIGISSYETKLGAGQGVNCTLSVSVMVSDEQRGSTQSEWLTLQVCRPLIVDAAQQLSRTADMIEGGLKEISNPREVFKLAKLISNDMNAGTSASSAADPPADDNTDTGSQENICACVEANTQECITSGTGSSARQKCVCRTGFGGAQCHLSTAQLEQIQQQRKEILAVALNFSDQMEISPSAVESQAQFLSEVSDPSQMDEASSLLSLGYASKLAEQSESSGVGMTSSTKDALTGLINVQLVDNIDRISSSGNTSSSTAVIRAQAGMQTLSSLLGAAATSMEVGEQPTSLIAPLFTASTSVLLAQDLDDMSLTGGNGDTNSSSVILSNSTLDGIQLPGTTVASQLVVLEEDPYGTGTVSRKITEFSLRSSNGTLRISNLTHPIKITLPAATEITTVPLEANTSNGNESLLVNCGYVGENHTIRNCSRGDPFNYTCKIDGLTTLLCPRTVWTSTCIFFDEGSRDWSTEGLNTIFLADGTVICETFHLTSFTTKFTSSLADFDDVLAAPLSKKVRNADDLFNLLASNVVMIVTMFALVVIFILSCVLVQRRDALDSWKHQRRKNDQVRALWAASHGILSVEALEVSVPRSTWCTLFVAGLRAYHPLLGVWMTHSILVTRPQRVMILMVVILVNMFASALFYRQRYADPNADPDFLEMVFFGAVSALLNVPVVAAFESLYQYAGASYITGKRYEMLAAEILKNDPSAVEAYGKENVSCLHEAKEYVNIVDGAIRHAISLVRKARTALALSRPASALHRLNSDELDELLGRWRRIREIRTGAAAMVSEYQQQMEGEIERQVHTACEQMDVRRPALMCCANLRRMCFIRGLRRRLRVELANRETHVAEKALNEVADRSNFLVKQLFHFNKNLRNPDMRPGVHGLWIRTCIDVFALLVVIFCAYFIVAFGFAYGQSLALAWLKTFLLSICCEFMFVDTVLIFVQYVMLPKFVAWTLFRHPELVAEGHHNYAYTPLMSGTRHALGPIGKHAFALGVTSAETVGYAAMKAQHWLEKTRKAKRKALLSSSVRYVADPDNRYAVRAIRSPAPAFKKTIKGKISPYSLYGGQPVDEKELRREVARRERERDLRAATVDQGIAVRHAATLEHTCNVLEHVSNQDLLNLVVGLLHRHHVENEHETRQNAVPNNPLESLLHDDTILQLVMNLSLETNMKKISNSVRNQIDVARDSSEADICLLDRVQNLIHPGSNIVSPVPAGASNQVPGPDVQQGDPHGILSSAVPVREQDYGAKAQELATTSKLVRRLIEAPSPASERNVHDLLDTAKSPLARSISVASRQAVQHRINTTLANREASSAQPRQVSPHSPLSSTIDINDTIAAPAPRVVSSGRGGFQQIQELQEAQLRTEEEIKGALRSL